eukprot:356232-Chlamydomonas_euryale.AAC.17
MRSVHGMQLMPTRHMLAVAKQAKAIGARLKLQRGGEDNDEDEEDGEADDKGADLWGASKRHYYDADTAALEGSDAEEAFAEEEEEGARLEAARLAKLRASDFGLDEDGQEEEEDEDSDDEEGSEATMGAHAKVRPTKSACLLLGRAWGAGGEGGKGIGADGQAAGAYMSALEAPRRLCVCLHSSTCREAYPQGCVPSGRQGVVECAQWCGGGGSHQAAGQSDRRAAQRSAAGRRARAAGPAAGPDRHAVGSAHAGGPSAAGDSQRRPGHVRGHFLPGGQVPVAAAGVAAARRETQQPVV